MKIQKKNRRWGGGRVIGGQDGSEQRIEVFVKIQKKIQGEGGWVWGSGWGGVRVDVNEVKFLWKCASEVIVKI